MFCQLGLCIPELGSVPCSEGWSYFFVRGVFALNILRWCCLGHSVYHSVPPPPPHVLEGLGSLVLGLVMGSVLGSVPSSWGLPCVGEAGHMQVGRPHDACGKWADSAPCPGSTTVCGILGEGPDLFEPPFPYLSTRALLQG